MIFFECFLICTFKEEKIGGKLDKFGGNLMKKISSVELLELAFCNSDSSGLSEVQSPLSYPFSIKYIL